MASKKAVVLVARESFVYEVKGVEHVVHQGELVSSNHQAAKAHPELFAPHDDVGVLAWTRARGWKLARWFGLLLIASLAIPALTKQWNDRTQELQVKESLLTDISKASAPVVYGAVAASFQPRKLQSGTRAELLSTWQRDRTALDPRFRVYFNSGEAADHWFGRGRLAGDVDVRGDEVGLRDTLLRYVYIACCERKKEMRAARLELLKNYLLLAAPEVAEEDPGKWSSVWANLECSPQERGCDIDPSTYRRDYRWLGDQLLNQRDKMMDQLLAANGEGFSSGWRDFIADVIPFR